MTRSQIAPKLFALALAIGVFLATVVLLRLWQS
jgi:hypothetical protein